jgi:uncharacterized protein YutE (UPF0331/DUF86 family)
MSLEIDKIRPRVISKETEINLSEYLSFRNLIRNFYAYEIDGEKVKPLIDKLEYVHKNLKDEIEEFIKFCRAMV